MRTTLFPEKPSEKLKKARIIFLLEAIFIISFKKIYSKKVFKKKFRIQQDILQFRNKFGTGIEAEDAKVLFGS